MKLVLSAVKIFLKMFLLPADAILITSDEAHFHLSGSVNRQNFRYWSESNPRELHEKPLHSERVIVWCAVANFGVWGPYFFWGRGKSGFSYFSSLCADAAKFFDAKTQESYRKCNGMVSTRWSNCPYGKNQWMFLRGLFPAHLISLHGDMGWPARSPDLSPCDYFLWGYVKSEVSSTDQQSLMDWKLPFAKQ